MFILKRKPLSPQDFTRVRPRLRIVDIRNPAYLRMPSCQRFWQSPPGCQSCAALRSISCPRVAQDTTSIRETNSFHCQRVQETLALTAPGLSSMRQVVKTCRFPLKTIKSYRTKPILCCFKSELNRENPFRSLVLSLSIRKRTNGPFRLIFELVGPRQI